MSYYDVVNFAKRLTAKSFFTWGFNDESCPPTSMYAAYNMIKSPKELALYLETGHWIYPEQKTQVNNWIINALKMGGIKKLVQ
jgi:cephalosporin-C deacetylase-like acetyl esterase